MHKERLKEYIEQDQIYQDWKSGKLTEISDFDKFCIEHVEDIRTLLKEVELLHSEVEFISKANKTWVKQVVERDNKIIKAIKELDRIIAFCENDSQGEYEICNIAIKNYKNIRNLLIDSGVDEI